MAIRVGSLTGSADRLDITLAAAGQRIRSLEDHLDAELLLRGRSGLMPTAGLEGALTDLKAAFAALDRVTESVDFQRVTETILLRTSAGPNCGCGRVWWRFRPRTRISCAY